MKGQDNCCCLGDVNGVTPQAVSAVIKGNNFNYVSCIRFADNSRNPRFPKGKIRVD